MRIAAVALSLALATGCARSHVEPEGDAFRDRGAAGGGEPSSAGRDGAGKDSGRDPVGPSPAGTSAGDSLSGGAGVASPVGAADAAVPATGGAGAAGAALEPPPSSSESTQVWIGQLWSITPLLCDPNAPWSSAVIVVQPMGYAERVVLILELTDDPAHPTGVIAFGEGDLPSVPEIPENGDPGSFWLCSVQNPSKGGEYTLLEARRSSDRLSFDIVSGEIWNASCPSGDASCHCSTNHCSVPPGQRQALDFLVTGDEMQTTFLAAGFGTSGELRLRRVE